MQSRWLGICIEVLGVSGISVDCSIVYFKSTLSWCSFLMGTQYFQDFFKDYFQEDELKFWQLFIAGIIVGLINTTCVYVFLSYL